MQCNQPFYGNGFTNGQWSGSPFNTPLQSPQGMYPEIVGEGQVTSVTLPDGSMQFFFIPTLKWWSPNAAQCNPFQTIPNPMFANTNYNIPPPYNNNVGTWFIRSISNPFPQSAFNPPSQQNELPRLAINADCNHNLNNHDLRYQVKFHNDGGTSTTDLVYFYPGLRQRDFVFMPPCKDKTVQIDTGPVTNTVCHYQVVCSKPCNCSVVAKPMSLENLVEPNLTLNSNRPYNYSADAKPMSVEAPVDPNLTTKSFKPCNCSVGAKPMSPGTPVDPNLTPKSNKPYNYSADANKPSSVDINLTPKSKKTCNCSACSKPISLETAVDPSLTPKSNIPNNYSADANKPSPVDPNLTLKSNKPYDDSVDTNKPMSVECLLDPNPTPKSNNTSTDESSFSKEHNKRGKNKKNIIICGCNPEDKKKKRNKSKNIICDCYPTAIVMSVDKSITTYADESVGSNPADGRETQTSRTEDITSQCDVDAKPMIKSPQKTKWIDKGCSSDCSTCDERSCDCDTSDKKHTQRNRGGKYKRSKPNKCECGCCDCDSPVDCCTDSEVEKVASKDKGRETPFTCSTCSNITVFEKPKGSPIKIGKKASIGKANSSLQWLTLDNVSQKCELMEEKMSVAPIGSSNAREMEGKSPEKLLDHTCTECDTAASTGGGGLLNQ